MLHEIRVLHLEPTDVCQAACPACARELDPEFDGNKAHHLTITQILAHIDQISISKLDKMFMCGTYGDPAAGQHTLDIYRFFKSINPDIVLGMNTNGALQQPEWWQQLAGVLQGHEDYVVFSIDGLEDTNHVYRRNVSWKKLMQNVAAFVAAGGSAHWDMLVYQHNEHQVDECQRLASDLGFSWFRAKVSKRPLVNNLAKPISWPRPAVTNGSIECMAISERSLYIDSLGKCHPCCWQHKADVADDFVRLQRSWNTQQPDSICADTCRRSSYGNNFTNQWQRNLPLHRQ